MFFEKTNIITLKYKMVLKNNDRIISNNLLVRHLKSVEWYIKLNNKIFNSIKILNRKINFNFVKKNKIENKFKIYSKYIFFSYFYIKLVSARNLYLSTYFLCSLCFFKVKYK